MDDLSDDDQAKREKLRILIDKHHGKQTAIAKALGITRQQVGRDIRRLKLVEEAGRARHAAGVKGARQEIVDPLERERMLQALKKHSGYRSAAKELGLSPRTMMRRMKHYDITTDEVEGRRAAG